MLELGKNISNLFRQYIVPVVSDMHHEFKLLNQQCDEFKRCETDSELMTQERINNPFDSSPTDLNSN